MVSSPAEVKHEGAARAINVKIEAKRLWSAGIVEAQGLIHLYRFNDNRCSPPLPLKDVSGIFYDSRPDQMAKFLAKLSKDDIGNAKRFVDRNIGKIISTPDGKWLEYRSGRWVLIDERGVLMQYAAPVAEAIANEAEEASGDDLTAVQKFAAKCRSAKALGDMTRLAHGDARMRSGGPDSFDVDPWLLNCPNGTLDLRTGEIRPHNPADKLRQMTGVAWDAEAKAPRWEKFIQEITSDRADLGSFLQRMCGYMVTGETREQAFFFLRGSGGNGKGVFVRALQAAIGDYGCEAPGEFLTERKNEGHPTEIARLYRKRMVFCSETEEGAFLNESLVKRLTGGDRLTARKMHEDFWEFEPTHKLALQSNYEPRIKGGGHSLWRRIRVVPFDAVFADSGDEALEPTLKAEAPGILAWCVRGCMEWQANGLGWPDAVVDAGEEYREGQNPLTEWIDECCQIGHEFKSGTRELFANYRVWVEVTGARWNCDEKGFVRHLKESGVTSGRTKTYRYLQGIALR
jgi:putative DNA primase/helicase